MVAHRPLQKLTFVLGGAASGKSVFAEGLVLNSGNRPFYVATSRVWDDEMSKKVADHKSRRGPEWTNREEPLLLDAALRDAQASHAVLVDCATLWLTNVILDDLDVTQAIDGFMAALAACPAPVVVVSNETGLGIVPENALARRFRNEQGRLNQRIAAAADTVVLVAAGLPLVMKGQLP